MTYAISTPSAIAQLIASAPQIDRTFGAVESVQDFYKQRIDPALDNWQRASDTFRALLGGAFQLASPWLAIAIRNCLMVCAVTAYTLFVVWRECSQHVWDCCLDNATAQLDWADAYNASSAVVWQAIALAVFCTLVAAVVRKVAVLAPAKIDCALATVFCAQ